jgi:hypothetical protein
VREELGPDVTLHAPVGNLESDTARSIPQPQQFLLEDINVADGEVGHQHIDFIYYGKADSRAIDPEPGEAATSEWEWYTSAELRANADRFPEDVVEVGQRAIDAVDVE